MGGKLQFQFVVLAGKLNGLVVETSGSYAVKSFLALSQLGNVQSLLRWFRTSCVRCAEVAQDTDNVCS